MIEETVTDIGEMDLPFNRWASVKNVQFESGLNMLRLTVREGRRFTVIDLDSESATKLGNLMTKWSEVSTPNPTK